MNDNQKTLLSFIVGAAAGVAAGMLLAPYSGQESRRKIVDGANNLKTKAGGQLTNTADKLSEYVDQAVNAVSGITGKGGQGTDKTNTANRTTTTTNPTGTTQY